MKITIVDAVIMKNNKLLLLKKFSKDYFEFPGGKLKKDEDLNSCLKREVKEEIGINIIKFKEVLKLKFDFENKEITDHIFKIEEYQNTPEIKEKIFEKLICADKKTLNTIKLAPNVERYLKNK